MNRPFLQKRIEELEALFESGQGDAATLRLLEGELKFRSVPRASMLLSRVRRVLNSEAASVHSAQNTLFDYKHTKPVQGSLISELELKSGAPIVESSSNVGETAASLGNQLMTVEEAFRVLCVPSSARWEEIEAARAKLVQLAHPNRIANLTADKRSTVQVSAMRANEAHRVLLNAKVG